MALEAYKGGLTQLQTGINAISKELNTVLSSNVLSDNSAKITELKQLVEYNKKAKSGLEAVCASLTEQLKLETNETTQNALKEQIATNTLVISVLENDIVANNETIKTLELTDKSTLENLQSKLTMLSKVVTRNE